MDRRPADIWDGVGGCPSSRGEGMVVGIIDSGANWGHVSFADPSSGVLGHDHVNPYGQQLGLCSEPEVECNDKLVGVYDFVEDLPDTEVVEEFNNGRDNGQHGAHVASTVAGNAVQGGPVRDSVVSLSGVAPNANIVSYRVCFAGDPDDPEDDGCINSQIVRPSNQAIEDSVDVINMSLGGGQYPSWSGSARLAYLNAYQAGIFVATSASNNGPGRRQHPQSGQCALADGGGQRHAQPHFRHHPDHLQRRRHAAAGRSERRQCHHPGADAPADRACKGLRQCAVRRG